jgi:hypothetical protein
MVTELEISSLKGFLAFGRFPIANESLRVPSNIHTPLRSLFYLDSVLRECYSNTTRDRKGLEKRNDVLHFRRNGAVPMLTMPHCDRGQWHVLPSHHALLARCSNPGTLPSGLEDLAQFESQDASAADQHVQHV